MAETTAEPLRQLGYYRIEEKPGTNAVDTVVSGDALMAYCEGVSPRLLPRSASSF